MQRPTVKECSKCHRIKDETEFRRWYSYCRKCDSIRRSQWNKDHPEQRHSQISKQIQGWGERWKKLKIKTSRNYALKHPEAEKIRHQKYYANHREKYSLYSNTRRASKRHNGGSYTSREWLDLCDRYENRCLACGSMEKLEADHVIPLALGGSNSIDNIQPLCHSCNAKKYTKTVDYRPGHNH